MQPRWKKYAISSEIAMKATVSSSNATIKSMHYTIGAAQRVTSSESLWITRDCGLYQFIVKVKVDLKEVWNRSTKQKKSISEIINSIITPIWSLHIVDMPYNVTFHLIHVYNYYASVWNKTFSNIKISDNNHSIKGKRHAVQPTFLMTQMLFLVTIKDSWV